MRQLNQPAPSVCVAQFGAAGERAAKPLLRVIFPDAFDVYSSWPVRRNDIAGGRH